MRRDTAVHCGASFRIFAADARKIFAEDFGERKPDVRTPCEDRLSCLERMLFRKNEKNDEDRSDIFKPSLQDDEWVRGPKESEKQEEVKEQYRLVLLD